MGFRRVTAWLARPLAGRAPAKERICACRTASWPRLKIIVRIRMTEKECAKLVRLLTALGKAITGLEVHFAYEEEHIISALRQNAARPSSRASRSGTASPPDASSIPVASHTRGMARWQLTACGRP